MNDFSPKRRNQDKLSRKVFVYIRRFFTTIGVMIFISAAFLSFTVYQQAGKFAPKAVPENTILSFTFDGELPEVLSHTNPAHIFQPQTRFHEITRALKAAKDDDRVKGFVARISSNQINLAQIQALRSEIIEFQKSGKFAYVFSASYGDFGNGMKEYYLASAFDNIWLQPIGNVSITGISGQLPFFKDALNKFGVNAEIYGREDYKTAAEPMMRSEPSPENVEMTTRLLSNIYEQMVSDIAITRNMSPGFFKALVDRAPLFDKQSLEAGLITHIGYLDELYTEAKEKSGDTETAELLEITAYNSRISKRDPKPSVVKAIAEATEHNDDSTENDDLEKVIVAETTEAVPQETDTDKSQNADQKKKFGKSVAIVYAVGTIMANDGRVQGQITSPMAPIGGGTILSAEDIVEALNDAREDDDIGAIVLRIDSPGGSATASETIARAVVRAREDGKYVLVSMGGAAASGGYWIATHADKIIAMPATLTGSIGVVAGKVVVGDLLDKVGVHIAEFNYGANADMWSNTSGFDKQARAQVNALLDNIYDAFLARVSRTRNIPVDKLRAEIAGGRVWTGQEGLDIGLVDSLGNLDMTVQLAKDMMGVPKGEKVPVFQFPREKNKIELLMDLLVNGVTMETPLDMTLRMVKSIPTQGSVAYAPLPRF